VQRSSIAVLALLAGLSSGCRSASPSLAPEAPEALAATPRALPELPSSEPEPDGVAPDAAELVAQETVPEPHDAEAAAELQREALDLCQSAEELLVAGHTEDAVVALDRAYELMLALPDGDGDFLQAKEDIRLLVSDLISRAYRSGQSLASTTLDWDLGFQVVDNEHVQRELRSFTGAEREAFLAGYRRAGRYRPMILARLEEAGLPSQLSWLPLVESWFKVRALSRASALGMWQFISSTGLRYGLTRDTWIDERFDPEKSTDAAIGYLTDLHGLFGDWPKALAGYNCGEARVQRLQRRSADQFVDFWDLYMALPRETRRYVPRLFAAIQIIENPERYGMELPEPDPPLETEHVEIDRSIELAQLDVALGLSAGTLAGLNPELRHKATPKQRYRLRVPAAQAPAVLAKLESVPVYSKPLPQYEVHRVRSGQTLSVIARRYRTSVSAIMRENNLRSAHRIRVGQRLRIRVRGSSGPARVASNSFDPEDGTHTVRRGDTLGAIARRYSLSVEELKQRNGLGSNLIHPGQRLRVSAPVTRASAAPGGAKRYRVASGDTLGAIADAHGVGLTDLLSVNGLSQRSTIYPGQWLMIPR
jgi:membrane-bound lytic murein transglycosylase D